MPRVSIVIPYHDMENGAFFLKRCIDSVMMQSFKDYEVVLTKEGKMAENANAGIRKAKGEIVKILFMDDYFANEDSLQGVADNFKGGWLVTGCGHRPEVQPIHLPTWNGNIYKGNNTIGSPSVLAFENKNPELFDEKMSWLLDCDLYMRLFKRYGEPTILNDINVIIGVGEHQTTYTLPDSVKQEEYEYMISKYA